MDYLLKDLIGMPLRSRLDFIEQELSNRNTESEKAGKAEKNRIDRSTLLKSFVPAGFVFFDPDILECFSARAISCSCLSFTGDIYSPVLSYQSGT